MDQFSHFEISDLMQNSENKKCFDCGNNNPLWASLNNAIFVCLKCAGIHRGFGVNVSFIRSLTIDAWDDRQIDYLKQGGNKRFRELLDEFKVPKNATMDFKYMIRASDYYRKLLKSEVYDEEPPFKPDIISGLEMLEYGISQSPQFDNFTPICSSNPVVKKEGFFDKVGSFWSKTKDQVKSTADIVGSKIKEMEIGDKLKQTGEQTLVYAKATGQFVVEKGKEVYQSEFVQNLAHKTEEGINVIIDKTKKILNQDKDENSDRLDFVNEINDESIIHYKDINEFNKSPHNNNINNINNINNTNISTDTQLVDILEDIKVEDVANESDNSFVNLDKIN